ncbi:hypothetical protein ACFPU0_25710 [Pseudomonas sp. GCM10022186]|uniref:hypothetical protein n=1 Tax=Pseudomonas sp. GCM10022186 TaxID=3252650 RepID=UPI00361EB2E9
MGPTILISTRPLAGQFIEQLISHWLPQDCWSLQAQSTEGRRWRLQLAVDPCSDPVGRMFEAVVMSHWLKGLEFEVSDGAG